MVSKNFVIRTAIVPLRAATEGTRDLPANLGTSRTWFTDASVRKLSERLVSSRLLEVYFTNNRMLHVGSCVKKFHYPKGTVVVIKYGKQPQLLRNFAVGQQQPYAGSFGDARGDLGSPLRLPGRGYSARGREVPEIRS